MAKQDLADTDVLIVGAGFSGICMAVHLDRIGTDYVIIERADGPGGVWRFNTYPGATCDTQSHHYSFSFEPNPDWSHVFSPQPEILDYLERTAGKYGVIDRTRFGTSVTRASWEDETGRWHVETDDGSSFRARVLVSAVGQLNAPAYPDRRCR